VTEGFQIISIDYLRGRKNLVYCQGKGPEDPNCLEKNPPLGKQMLPYNYCCAGLAMHGFCRAIFADPKEHPDLFKIL
jgi:hypothetical protein